MARVFNVTGNCDPADHYMVDLSERLDVIRKMISSGQYITVNRARQYGKTTTLHMLRKVLSEEYYVALIDFQTSMTRSEFENQNDFALAFALAFSDAMAAWNCPENVREIQNKLISAVDSASPKFGLIMLFRYLKDICRTADKPVVLMIDEIDRASNNQIFLDFLSLLRGGYIERASVPTFRSVILAGVHDIRNLQLKIRPDSEHRHNSPWNIANALDIDMSFSCEDIAGMLKEYEADHNTGMDIERISEQIFDYTYGYPVLVSMICRINDEKLSENAWTDDGIAEAAKIIVNESVPLFESLINKIEDNPDLRDMLYSVLFKGEEYTFTPDNHIIGMAHMYGFITNDTGKVRIANRIFETRLYNYFLSVEKTSNALAQDSAFHRNEYIENGTLNMEKILERFIVVYTDIYGSQPEEFLEEAGRRLFLLFIRPIINGSANYYIEARTRDLRRTDLIIDYKGKQYIIEMKIWHGAEYNERGEKQLADYLDFYHTNKGYMLSFNFNKNKQTGTKTISVGDKTIFEAVV